MKKWMRLAMTIGVLSVPTLLVAQSGLADGDEHHHGPSPEAIAACKAKSEGDACEYDGAHGHEAGMCRKVRTGDLACVHPHHHPEQDGGRGSRRVARGLTRAAGRAKSERWGRSRGSICLESFSTFTGICRSQRGRASRGRRSGSTG